MQFGSTQTRVILDGEKLVDDTVRHELPLQQASFIVPQFDDEDDSSSSDDETAMESSNMLLKKQFINECSNNNDGDSHDECAGLNGRLSRGQTQHMCNNEVQWDHAQQLQKLTNANTVLSSEARDLRQQVKTLQIQLEAQAPVPGLDVDAVHEILLDKEDPDHDIRDAKIVHQAKSLRTLKRLLQREKQLTAEAEKQSEASETSNKQLAQEIDTLKLKLQRFQARVVGEKTNSLCAASVSDSPADYIGDNNSNDGTLRKICEELRAKNTTLQQELKKTQRALIREVGDDAPLEDVVNNIDNAASGSSRRGRAQRIIMLKSKVKRLQTQLATIKQESAETGTQKNKTATTVLDVDQRAQQDLSDQKMHQKKMMDQLTRQRDELQERLHRLTRKYDALKARVQILDRERQELRDKFQVMVEKSGTDDALVDALQRQLETWKTKLHHARRVRTADGMKSMKQVERAELEQLRKIVSEHKEKGGDRSASSALWCNGAMPQPSEISQYRAIAVEKERLSEVVCNLKTQLEDKDKQLRSLQGQQGSRALAPETPLRFSPSSLSLPFIGDESVSRIPRVRGSNAPPPKSRKGGVYKSSPPPPLAICKEQQHQEVETLRNTFRESMREKDDRIAELEQQHQLLIQSGAAAMDATDANECKQELQELQEENDYLRQEFHKLKTRYEALVKET